MTAKPAPFPATNAFAEWPIPLIDRQRCDGCGACVAACRQRALAVRAGKALVVNPAACAYAGACEQICPQGAIARPFLVVVMEHAGGAADE